MDDCKDYEPYELSDLEGKSLKDIGDWVDLSKIPCDCSWRKGRDVILSGTNIKAYPHEGGIHVEDREGKQWVYVHCSACGYDWALWKLVNRAKAVKAHPEMYVEQR